VPTREFWNDRYRDSEYVYGQEPNDFVREQAHHIPIGDVLCLAEGEGRNAVFLAGLGHRVTAVDFSPDGLRKATALAKQRGVELATVEADLATFDLGTARWDGIVSSFGHTSPEIRRRVHRAIAAALRPGGAFVLEQYRPEQIALGTGGPKDPTLTPTLAELRADLADLDLIVAREADREVHEGKFHAGRSATVQIVGIKRS